MLNFILTYVKGLVKMTFYHRFILGPLITAAGLLSHGLMVGYGVIPNSAAGLYLLFLLSGFIGGLRSGLVSAAMLAVYNVAALGPITAERTVVICSYFLAAALVGWKTRQWRHSVADALAGWERAASNEQAARAMEALNGNVYRIRTARERLMTVLTEHRLDEPTRNDMREVLHVLNNLELATAGWQQLAKVKEELE